MHDSMTVAFEIPRPWPRRDTSSRWYWPPLVTVWHCEPGDHDPGDVCRHYRRYDVGGRAHVELVGGWRWHVHHWYVQVPPLQGLRRRLFTRCAWCGGRHSAADPVNVALSWDRPRTRWWRGEAELHHMDCSEIRAAHACCVCDDPVLEQESYGQCAGCVKRRAFGMTPARLARVRELAVIPLGGRFSN